MDPIDWFSSIFGWFNGTGSKMEMLVRFLGDLIELVVRWKGKIERGNEVCERHLKYKILKKSIQISFGLVGNWIFRISIPLLRTRNWMIIFENRIELFCSPLLVRVFGACKFAQVSTWYKKLIFEKNNNNHIYFITKHFIIYDLGKAKYYKQAV